MTSLFGRDRTTKSSISIHRFLQTTCRTLRLGSRWICIRSKLNLLKFFLWTLAMLPLFAGKGQLLNWVIKRYPNGGYSFSFHLASTISWKVEMMKDWNVLEVSSGQRSSGQVEWKQSGGYTNIFHFCNPHNNSLLAFNFTQIVEVRSISIIFFWQGRACCHPLPYLSPHLSHVCSYYSTE